MRRPRAGDERSSRTRVAPGLRPGALRPPARSSLTAGREACPRFSEKAAQKGPASREPQGKAETERQKARPGAVTTLRWRAERRHTFARGCDLRPNDAPLGAPSPRFLRGKERSYGVPGASKNTGVGACPVGTGPQD